MDRHREEKAKNEPTYPSIVLIILSQPLMWTQTRAFLQAAEQKSIIPKTFVCINRVLWVWSQRHHVVTGYCSTWWPPHPFILEPLIVDFMKASNVSPLFLNVPLLILCVGKLTTLVSTNVGIIENLCGFALRIVAYLCNLMCIWITCMYFNCRANSNDPLSKMNEFRYGYLSVVWPKCWHLLLKMGTKVG